MADLVANYLKEHGPVRSSVLAAALQAEGLSPEAARQRLSRTRPPIFKFPLRLLPKNEAFFYLKDQRNTELFWANFLRDMRETGSIFGIALDGMIARGGRVYADQFAVISGAPARPMKKQLSAERVAETLSKASVIREYVDADSRKYLSFSAAGGVLDINGPAELVMLDAVREWARKLGFASYNSIAIRGEDGLVPIGPFMFDLAGPSWFGPIPQSGGKPGFLVADVFAEGPLTEHQIQFFIRKVTMLKAMRNGMNVMPILVAESFTGAALTAGHAAGISLATPTILFGRRVGAALVSLVQTLKNAAAYASANDPDRIVTLINDLAEIEGRAGNLRGILFELLAAYLSRRDAVSIDMGIKARDPTTGMSADIDILKVTAMGASVTCIECKGKEPGGAVTKGEVEEWLRKTAIMKAHLAVQYSFREAEKRFEIWTSGTFDADALTLLTAEQARRTKSPIGWKDGRDVLAIATAGKEKAMADALQQHFLKHPLQEVAVVAATLDPENAPSHLDQLLAIHGPAPFGGYLSLPAPTKAGK